MKSENSGAKDGLRNSSRNKGKASNLLLMMMLMMKMMVKTVVTATPRKATLGDPFKSLRNLMWGRKRDTLIIELNRHFGHSSGIVHK